MSIDKEALEFHSQPTPGKVEVTSSKPCHTEKALSLAYSPGVAAPCREIANNPDDVFRYTTKGNLVAVISNGTAVLGLGNIGPLASKPVMEGKGVLFKEFANINVFDLELNALSVDEFCQAVKTLEPTFGGINLEDIRAPECFEIEERLKKEMNIPVFHDDQHGTAIISGAALINACIVSQREIDSVRLVINGAGAAAISCARIFHSLGVPKNQITICDSKGVVYKGRTEGMNRYKEEFALDTEARTLSDALKGADVFIGLSVAGVLSPEMLSTMNQKPIVFAMANPDPEISPPDALKVRPDIIMATGRSDFPNQVNNVLGFPFIFRGALDVHATQINEAMKLAAVHALARLAREDVPEKVSVAYNGQNFRFGPNYIIPKPFDSRVLLWVAPAVARAAMESGVAKSHIDDFEVYKEKLESLQGRKMSFVRSVINRVKAKNTQEKKKPRIIFPEGNNAKILKAIHSLVLEDFLHPILVGEKNAILSEIENLGLMDSLSNIEILDPSLCKNRKLYIDSLFNLRCRRGIMWQEAERLMDNPDYYAAMAVHLGNAEGLVTGATQNYADCVRPVLEIIGSGKRKTASGLNILLWQKNIIFCADTAVNINPTADQIATIAIHAAKVTEYFGFQPKIAMLSYTNFKGQGENPRKMSQAAEIVSKAFPQYKVDGEMQADTAVNSNIAERIFPFSEIKDGANTLIFPNLDAGNIAYKLLQQLGGGEVLGPFLLGVVKPANIVQRTGSVDDVFNTAVITALQAHTYAK